MAIQKRIVLTINLLLCAAIAVALALLARRLRDVPPEPPASPGAVPSSPQVTPNVPPVSDKAMSHEVTALREEIKAIKDDSREESRRLHERRLTEASATEAMREEWEQEWQSKSLTYAELAEAQDSFPDIYRRIKTRWLEEARKRMEARQCIREHLDTLALDAFQKRRILEYFAHLDEFDRNVTLREYDSEEAVKVDWEARRWLREACRSEARKRLDKAYEACIGADFTVFSFREDFE